MHNQRAMCVALSVSYVTLHNAGQRGRSRFAAGGVVREALCLRQRTNVNCNVSRRRLAFGAKKPDDHSYQMTF